MKGKPNFRFYAGSPITTENGINIGCLFVLDPQPRDGLSEVEINALGTTASLVMDFLRISRQASEGRRTLRLSKGLSNFVDGSSSFLNKHNPHKRSNESSISYSSESRSKSKSDRSAGKHRTSHKNLHGSHGLSTGKMTDEVSEDKGCSSGFGSSPFLGWNVGITSIESVSGAQEQDTWAFQRAANLLRESLELTGKGGVAFRMNGNRPTINEDENIFHSKNANEPATLLALSTQDEPFGTAHMSATSDPASSVDRTFLQRLFRRYPKGKLWSFHRDGTLTKSDEESSAQSANDSSDGGHRNVEPQTRASERSLLNGFFPGASQVIFVPLWDAAKSQWHSGCFCWNTQEDSVFSTAVDLSAVTGFASSIMTEYNRLESFRADQRKGDFISNISHELRSPLHDILASAEFLEDTDPTEFQKLLIETINSCGGTLLDTMNQVLDFGKIMSLSQNHKHSRHERGLFPRRKGDGSFQSLDLLATDVSQLVEEVVTGVCRGHNFGKLSASSTNEPMLPAFRVANPLNSKADSPGQLDVILDIQVNDWLFMIQPGFLRRVIVNVLGNALKNTSHGHIIIHLKSETACDVLSRREGPKEVITITISDTGKGISSSFLRQSVFMPFVQEDSLAEDAGLGLSIVRSLMDAMNGSIEIDSHPGKGTNVTLSFPFLRPVGPERENTILSTKLYLPLSDITEMRLLLQNQRNIRLAGWGLGASANTSSRQFWSSVRCYITEWLALSIESFRSTAFSDVVLIHENDITPEAEAQLGGSSLMIIFCSDPGNYRKRQAQLCKLCKKAAFVLLPCGPRSLARSLLDLLGYNMPFVAGDGSTSKWEPPNQVGVSKSVPIRNLVPQVDPIHQSTAADAPHAPVQWLRG